MKTHIHSVIAGLTRNLLLIVNKCVTNRMGLRVKPAMTGVFLLFLLPIAAQTQLTNLPTLYITTNNGQDPVSKETYLDGHILIKSSDPTEELDMNTQIRARGNSTLGAAKKPYRIKLEKGKHILNCAADEKSWVLLANDFDRSLIRNAVAFKISELVGMAFTPSTRFVDLVLNGTYRGNYMLTDQVNVDKHRVPIEKQAADATGLPAISGGYLVEVDGFASGEPWWFSTSKGVPVTVKYPQDEELAMEQYNYIKGFTQTFETALFANNFTNAETGYRQYVDTASLVNWYIACELTGNPDSFWSIFMYKFYDSDKFFFGPLWDFDIAFNNDGRLGDATYKLMRDHAHDPKTWIKQIWKDDWFKRAVYFRWTELNNSGALLQTLTNYIDETVALISDSQVKNEEKWHKGGFAPEVANLKTYLGRRINFLTESFSSDVPEPPTSPFEQGNYYYTLMNVKSNNVIDVLNASQQANELLEMRNPKEDNHDSQYWVFKPVAGLEDAYQIINKNSSLAVKGNGLNQQLTQVQPDINDYTQIWKVVPVTRGDKYGIVNMQSKLSINNSGGGMAEGTPVIEYTANIEGSENQQWYLKRMETYLPVPEFYLSVETIRFNNVKVNATSNTKSVIVITENLTDEVTYSFSGADAGAFTATPDELPVAGGKFSIYFKPTEIKSYTATLTISSEGAVDKTVNLLGTGIANSTAIATVSDEKISVYPNPVTDHLFIQTNAAHTDVQLFSIEGRCLYSRSFTKQSIELPVAELGVYSGIYLLRVNGQTQKIVVR